ncbi:hypothetical protein N0V83_008795 [Neocucurbitaria cava]|uniref:Uncharacterized protein n=1 Tax=Neocucurbitaria cava TaxID=798079 RepID=A0A9W9CJ40_9PLEO|nr:hypothetical protein N0V83_008795 [Neocucurbitaria cava]
MRFSAISLFAAGLVVTMAQDVGKVALCNDCWQLGTGAPTCSDNNYIHWGPEDGVDGECDDPPSVFDSPCEADSSSNIETPLGEGPYTPEPDCDANAENGTLMGTIVGLRSGGPGGGVFKYNCYKELDTFTNVCGFTYACNIYLICRQA